jgi:pyrophosphatase PpaX
MATQQEKRIDMGMGRTEPPEAVLFDVDGTLIDTFHLYLESYRRALEPYLGYPPPLEEFAARQPTSERHFLGEWLGPEHAAECHATMCAHYEELHASLCGGAYDGVREMLAALRSAGIAVGVVTGKGRRAWEVTASSLDLGPFAAVVTEDDVVHPKPHPGGLLAALEAIGVAPRSAAYIGDSAADIAAGRVGGMRVGAALWPKETPEDRQSFLDRIRDHEPDWLFERPADVTRAFARWC